MRHHWGDHRVPDGVHCFPYLGNRYVRDLYVTATLPPGWVVPHEIQTSLAALNHALDALGPNGPFEAVRALYLVAFALRRALENARRKTDLQAVIRSADFERSLADRALKAARKAAEALGFAEQARDVAIQRLDESRKRAAPAPDDTPPGMVSVRGYVRRRH